MTGEWKEKRRRSSKWKRRGEDKVHETRVDTGEWRDNRKQ